MNFKRILVPVDFSQEAHLAVEWASRIGNDQPQEVVLYLLHVVPFPPVVPEPEFLLHEAVPKELALARIDLESWQSKVPPPLASTVIVVQGDPITEIKRICEDEAIDLVVMTTHGREGLSRLVIPNLTEKVARVAPCPVLALHLGKAGQSTTTMARVSRILVPVDFTADSNMAIDWAVDLLKNQSNPVLSLLHVFSHSAYLNYAAGWNDEFLKSEWDEEKRTLEDKRASLPSDIRSEFLIGRGPVAGAVREACEKYSVELVVMVSRGRRGISRMLHPNTSDRIVRSAPCPVLVLHQNRHAQQFAKAG